MSPDQVTERWPPSPGEEPGELADGRFRLERALGHGGMSSVYLAHDRQLGRQVAVKLLSPALTEDADVRQRFLREARLAASLSHPNVVQVFDTGSSADGRPYIVMEYVEGRSLAQELAERGRLPPEEVVAVGVQLCAALEHAHAAGLVHRDVKPHNLLRRPDGTVKIADFGIARAAGDSPLTQYGTVLGTAAYLAPEQARGEPVTTAADLYATGAVLYELLTGSPPRRFETLAQLVAGRRDSPIAPVRKHAHETSAALEAAVMRALEPRARLRPSATELGRELAASLSEPQTQLLPRARRSAPRPAVRLRRLAVALSVLAFAGVFAAAISLGDSQPKRTPPPAAVETVPRADDPAEQARLLAAWIRARAESAQPGGPGRSG